ncbi:MAG: MepB domain containing protein [Chlamydiia bacterium]|nr:MepB domain containing protein [Chlamydiia bacterium]
MIHPDLLASQKLAYEPSGLTSCNFIPETESKEYAAYDFEMNARKIKFRVAKSTPIKIGQFVTFWKRIGDGPIMPFDMADPIDFFIVSVRTSSHFGQFVFPKAVLCAQDIVSKEGKGGKRAMRVYPPWDTTDSPQAKKTQAWQLLYFFEICLNQDIDSARVQQLFL